MIALVLGVKYFLIIVNENDVSMTTKSKISFQFDFTLYKLSTIKVR